MIDDQNLNTYIKSVINFSFDSNKYFNDLEPWKLKKENLNRMNTVLYCILNQIKSISILLYPIMPNSIEKNFLFLGLDKKDILIKHITNINFLTPGHKINKTDILFKKIESD